MDIPVPLTVVDSSYRDLTGPGPSYIADIRAESPRDVVSVFIPEYVVGHWWEQLLHNQSALRLKARLLFQPGVMVTNVPWQLGSAQAVERHIGSLPALCGSRRVAAGACDTLTTWRQPAQAKARGGRRCPRRPAACPALADDSASGLHWSVYRC